MFETAFCGKLTGIEEGRRHVVDGCGPDKTTFLAAPIDLFTPFLKGASKA
jgi:hypothetical protein